MQTTPPRANDPETHRPYRQATWLEKLARWAWVRWGRKLNVKIAAMAGPVIGMISASLGHTPDAQLAIGIGLSAALLGAIDIAISYATTKFKLPSLDPLQKISEEAQQTQSEINWREIFAAPAVPVEPRFKPLTVGGWTNQEIVAEPVRYPTSTIMEGFGANQPGPSTNGKLGYSVEYTAQGRIFTDTFGTIAEAIAFRDEIRAREGLFSAKIIKP